MSIVDIVTANDVYYTSSLQIYLTYYNIHYDNLYILCNALYIYIYSYVKVFYKKLTVYFNINSYNKILKL
jgi:hypothetical protein